MKILFVGNNRTERCGVAEFGRHHVAALRKLGHEVRCIHFDAGHWHHDPRPESKSPSGGRNGVIGGESYDVLHMNWHAGTLNADEALRLYGSFCDLKSAYLHESSPAWNDPQHRPPLLDQVDVAFVDHPSVEKAIYFRTPVWDVDPTGVTGIPWLIGPWIGCTGIRGEGVEAVKHVCAKAGWRYSTSAPDKWLTPQQEVTRLANCWINVAHYGAGFGGQASAMGALIAAGQPILINSNRMLETWREFAEPFGSVGYEQVDRVPNQNPQLYLNDNLEEGLLTILADIRDGKARRPLWLREAFSWPRQAGRMVAEWERRLK